MYRAQPSLVTAFLLAIFAARGVAQEQIPWITDLRQARQLAEQQQRLVLLHFWSESCPPCRALEQNVFNQPEVIRLISTGFIPVKINVLQQPKYADFYKIDRVPTDILVDHTGHELYRSTSPQSITGYMAMLDQVRAHVAVSAGKALEAMAQSKLNQFTSALPPMTNGLEEPAASESINANPELPAANQDSWRSAPATNGPSFPGAAQPSPMQNEFSAVDRSGMPRSNELTTGAARPTSRQGNPYLQTSGTSSIASRAESTSEASQNESAARPWDKSNNPSTSGNTDPQYTTANRPTFGNSSDPNALSSNAPKGQSNSDVAQQSSGTQQPNVAANPPMSQPPVIPQQQNVSMPSNVPPLAMDGFCPVTLVLMSKWVKGDPRWGVIHRGRTYLLGSQSDQQRFLADPDRFSPALSGYDPVRFAESGQLVDGKREHGLFLTNSYYLFADEGALSRFESQPQGYVNVVRQAMANARPNAPQR